MEQERLKTLSEHYEQLEKQNSDWGLPACNQNLIIDLMQEFVTELGLFDCWTCGGPWPWKGESLTPEQLLKWDNDQISIIMQRPEGWILDQRIIGIIFISREGRENTIFFWYKLAASCFFQGVLSQPAGYQLCLVWDTPSPSGFTFISHGGTFSCWERPPS